MGVKRRWLSHVLTVLLLLPTAIAVSIWALSYTEYKACGLASRGRSHLTGDWRYTFEGYASHKGRLTFGSISESNSKATASVVWDFTNEPKLGNNSGPLLYPEYSGEHWGFGLYRPNATAQFSGIFHTGWAITVPCWFATLVTVPLAALGLRRIVTRLKRRRIDGICFNCGYDLRATPQRCPECGTIPQDVSDTRPAEASP